MTLTNEEMFDPLSVLSQAEETGMLGYAIAVNRRKISSEVTEYANKRDELLRKYGADQRNGQFTMSPNAAAEFFAEFKPYREMTADVSDMQGGAVVFCAGSLNSQHGYALGWMVKEGAEETRGADRECHGGGQPVEEQHPPAG